MSALLLQLVQTSAHDVRMEASRIAKERQQLVTLRRQESFTEQDASSEPFLDELDNRVSHCDLPLLLGRDGLPDTRIFVYIVLV